MKKKKGFTLVELLVVIAILAVLATVSVVGYMGFTKKAQESNDIGLTAQMNTILQAEEVTNKPTTPHEAVKQLANGGVDVEKLTPRTDGYNYVYDLDANRIFLLNTDKQPVAPTNIDFTKDNKVFAIVGNETEYNTWKDYSVYLKTNFEMTSTNLFSDLKTGLDVGSNKIDAITYTGSAEKEALIRTNGGTLTINAGADTVYHYGASDYVNVIAINTNSYHEFGAAAYARIASGHFVAESSAKIVNLNVASSSVTVTEENGATVGTYSKSEENVTVTVNGTTKEVNDVKSEDDIKNAVSSSEVVAEDGVAEVNGIKFKSLKAAVDIANDGDVVTLISDYSFDKELVVNKNLTIDFNGHVLNYENGNNGSAISINEYTLLLKDSTVSKSGKLISSDYGVSSENDGLIIVEDIEINSAYACLSGNNQTGNMNFTVKSGTLTSKYSETVYMPGQGTLNIFGGVLNGGISLRMGTVNMTGGVVNGMKSTQDSDPISNYWNYSGSAWIGDAIYVMAGTYSTKFADNNNCVINVTGGTINGNAHNAVCVYDIGTKCNQKVLVNISKDVSVTGNIKIDRDFTTDSKYNRTYPADVTITTSTGIIK